MAKSAKVILRRNVENLGEIGDIASVKPGYARNYLIPQGLAYYATPASLKAIEAEKKRWEKIKAIEKADAEKLAAQLADLQISVPMKVGEEGKLYGSVTSQMIADELALRGYEIDKKNVLIEEPIKTLGIFDVKVKLFQDVTANLKVWVMSEE